MLQSSHRDGPRPKCHFTHSVLPAFVDHDHPPQKKRPFSTIAQNTYTHTLDLVLPKGAHDSLLAKLGDKRTLRYARVFLKLSDLVEGDFFNDYIKSGNILMLSEGRRGHDNVFSLRDGILRLELDKASYERTGFSGTVIPNDGRKHVKARYAVEVNLRLPSMVRGKQGFERILWAFRNVLDSRLAWLLHDLRGSNDGTGPVASHHPIIKTAEPEVEALEQIAVPPFSDEVGSDEQQTPVEFLEWLSLVMSTSPRVRIDDDIDAYLSEYRIPGDQQSTEPPSQDLERVRWRGFMPSSFVQLIFIAALKAGGTGWFALSGRFFGGGTHMVLQHEHQTFTWEFEG